LTNEPDIRLAARGVIIRDRSILMVEFTDINDPHYNIPGGGVRVGETLREAVRREVMEETGGAVSVGELLFVYEHVQYATHITHPHVVSFFFRCNLLPETEPCLPETPDPNQTGVHWVPFNRVPHVTLYPLVNDLLLQAIEDLPANTTFIETRPI
jgi:ADP-ribose pyrophosphatase YjhB (NUDIX family)